MHVSRLLVRRGSEMCTLLQDEMRTVLQYQLGETYDRNFLRDADTDRPYFVRGRGRQDIFFDQRTRDHASKV